MVHQRCGPADGDQVAVPISLERSRVVKLTLIMARACNVEQARHVDTNCHTCGWQMHMHAYGFTRAYT